MNVFQMRDKLKARLKQLDVEFKFDREEETLRIVRIDKNKKKRLYMKFVIMSRKQSLRWVMKR